jgi:NTP pyrophosphatase (non-canonical NTP hydrolase)
MRISAFDITALDAWLDDNVSAMYREQPLAQDWARLSKMAEEVGECIQAYIGATGQNPRKGIVNDMDDVLDEAVDVIVTAIMFIQHTTKDAMQTADLIEDRWEYRMKKAGLESRR